MDAVGSTSLAPEATIAPVLQESPCQVCVGDQSLCIDHGGVRVGVWSDRPSMVRDLMALIQRIDITIRWAGGALIADLSLQDNLMLEAALYDGNLPQNLVPEMDTLFANANCHVDWAIWNNTLADTAPANAVMQAQVGRALMADPDVVVLDAAQWDEALLDAHRFSRCFTQQYPWRTLVWATTDMGRANGLRFVLKEFLV